MSVDTGFAPTGDHRLSGLRASHWAQSLLVKQRMWSWEIQMKAWGRTWEKPWENR